MQLVMLFDDSSLLLYVLLIIEGFIVGGGVICVGGDFEKILFNFGIVNRLEIYMYIDLVNMWFKD